MIKVSPSLLAADFGRLAAEVELINRSEASMLHLDVMDGVFVPNISFGFPVIKSVASLSTKPLDVHIMTVEPEKWISRLRDLGVAIMNVHVEACRHLHRAVEAIREAGMSPAVTLNPSTPVEQLRDIVADLDMVLLMSVDPGFGGQKFIKNTLNKIDRLKDLIDATGSKALIEIDGGINLETAAACAKHGADVLVAGSFVFHSPDPIAAVDRLASVAR